MAHSMSSCALVYAFMLGTGLCADSYLSRGLMDADVGQIAPGWCAPVLFGYWTMLMLLRCLGDSGCIAQDIYHLMFSCNVAIFIAAVSIVLQRPALLCAQGILVAIDQVLWYVDIFGWLLTGSLPLKVIGYLFWPTTSIWRKITCVHHVLFEPLIICLSVRFGGVPVVRGFLISIAQTIACQMVCRYTTPLEIMVTKEKEKETLHYLNINLCYECFRDVKAPCIRRYDRARAMVYIPWMLLIWNVGNILLFVALAVLLLLPMRLMLEDSSDGARLVF
eukprot:TRINITY_DN32238_c0_g1_i1.p1 TRINITY_DN32238_c0_g1~~TRINITY_DN32238_c0_g1_i1.p1  ORF type:complete len:322 (+),score=39.68 TRINITY_DN32238_c0_g1_i1:137-967(+)